MEPLFFKAENGGADGIPPADSFPSMEPLFFKAENAPLTQLELEKVRPSMEPLFFKAENESGGCTMATLEAFNGAAFFQSGKSGGPKTQEKRR